MPFLLVGLCAALMVVGVLQPWLSGVPPPEEPIRPWDRWDQPAVRLEEPQYRERVDRWPNGELVSRWSGLSPAFLGRWTLVLGLLVALAAAILGALAARGVSRTATVGGHLLIAFLVPALALSFHDVGERTDALEHGDWLRGDFGLMLTLVAGLMGSLLAIRNWPPVWKTRRQAPRPPLEVFE